MEAAQLLFDKRRFYYFMKHKFFAELIMKRKKLFYLLFWEKSNFQASKIYSAKTKNPRRILRERSRPRGPKPRLPRGRWYGLHCACRLFATNRNWLPLAASALRHLTGQCYVYHWTTSFLVYYYIIKFYFSCQSKKFILNRRAESTSLFKSTFKLSCLIFFFEL